MEATATVSAVIMDTPFILENIIPSDAPLVVDAKSIAAIDDQTAQLESIMNEFEK